MTPSNVPTMTEGRVSSRRVALAGMNGWKTAGGEG
jgi:hypothetical protein